MARKKNDSTGEGSVGLLEEVAREAAGNGAGEGDTHAGPKPDKPSETREQKFRRLVERRVPNAIRAIGYVKNLAGPGYKFTEDQAAFVVQSLQLAVNQVQDAFLGRVDVASMWRLPD